MKKSIILPVLIIVLSINFLTLGILMIVGDFSSCPNNNSVVEEKTVKEVSSVNVEVPGDYEFLRGSLRKELVSVDLEDSDDEDFIYRIYLDNPYMCRLNSTGVPIYMDDIQVYPSEYGDLYDIEDFVGQRVEVYGYAICDSEESGAFQMEAIRVY